MKNLETTSTAEICVWKVTANNDEEKRALGRNDYTLEKDIPCNSCDGYDFKCLMYYPSRETEAESLYSESD